VGLSAHTNAKSPRSGKSRLRNGIFRELRARPSIEGAAAANLYGKLMAMHIAAPGLFKDRMRDPASPPLSAPSGQMLGTLLPGYLDYCQYERNFGPATIFLYGRYIRRVIGILGDRTPSSIGPAEILQLKIRLASDGCGPMHIRSVLFGLRSLLRYCKDCLNLTVLDPMQIRPPKLKRREVIFLTGEEVEEFVSAIPLIDDKGTLSLKWLSIRAFVEVLLGTGLRISEALSLTRSQIDFDKSEAKVIGKGNKERKVFFSPRSLRWLKEYLTRREDNREELFLLHPAGTRLLKGTAQSIFRLIRQRTGIKKPITAHILRHTVATTLLNNGCPIGHIQQILGHEEMETTCKYYLGTDRVAAKEAHRTYLDYAPKRSGMTENIP